MQEVEEIQVQSLGWEDPLEKGMASHSSILAWRILWTEEPGRLQFMGLPRVRHDWSNLACTCGSESTESYPLDCQGSPFSSLSSSHSRHEPLPLRPGSKINVVLNHWTLAYCYWAIGHWNALRLSVEDNMLNLTGCQLGMRSLWLWLTIGKLPIFH